MIQPISVYIFIFFAGLFALTVATVFGFGIWQLIRAKFFPERQRQLMEKRAAAGREREEKARLAAQGRGGWLGGSLSLLFMLGGLFIAAQTVWFGCQVARARLSWTAAECTITVANVAAIHSTGRNSSTTYKPGVKYSYEFGGATYAATKFDFAGNDYWSKTPVELILLFYPVGREVGCYVNPVNPSEAVLDAGFWQLFNPGRFAGFIIFFGVGAMIFLIPLRRTISNFAMRTAEKLKRLIKTVKR